VNSFFLQGLQHPLLTPSHLIILIALGILLGQQGRQHSTVGLLVFSVSVFLGLVITRFYSPEITLEISLLVIAGVISMLIILKLSLPRLIMIVFAMLTGGLIGVESAPVLIPGLKASRIYTDMAGSLISVSLILLLVTVIAIFINRLWQGIALRIMGSWLFASAMMVLALMFAPVKM
jgi:hydrogenase/urease accessory protein HupE